MFKLELFKGLDRSRTLSRPARGKKKEPRQRWDLDDVMMGAYLQLQMSPSVLLVALTFFMKGKGTGDGMATATASG